MGFTNGIRANNTTVGDKGDKGVGFKLTEDGHYHLENKRLTNVAEAVKDNDAVTKKFLTNSLKTKAGTNYVSNELAKKANLTSLNNYVLKSSLPSSNALNDYYTKSAVDSALSVKVDQANLSDYYTKLEIESKNAFLHFDTLRHNNSKVVKWNIDDCDTANNYNTFDISQVGDFDQFKVLRFGYYEITFLDSFKGDGRVEIHVTGDPLARSIVNYNGNNIWQPLCYHVVIKLQADDTFNIKCTGSIILDGEHYNNFTIKKIG